MKEDTKASTSATELVNGGDMVFSSLLEVAGEGAAGAAYGLAGFPYFVLLDAEGKVVGRSSGQMSGQELEQFIGRSLNP